MDRVEKKRYTFAELFETASGLSKGREEFGFGNPFVTFKDVFYNTFLEDNLIELANTSEAERERCSVKCGDVFLTRTSETMNELGFSAVALRDYPQATFNGFTKRLRLKSNLPEIDPVWLGYFLRSKYFREQVNGMAVMTTRASLNNEMIERFYLDLPPLLVQKRVASFLKTIDDKIKLNRKMNETLESTARAIFKSWFVDFDPVRAKQQGNKPFGMGDETAALFPSEFEDSELGPIPKGWRVASVDDIFDINPSYQLSKGQEYPYVEMANVPTNCSSINSFRIRPFTSGSKFSNGDTLIARITPCLENGKTAFVDLLPTDIVGWGSTEFIVLRSKAPYPKVASYLLAREENFRAHLISNMTGSSGRQRVPESCLSNFYFVLPSNVIGSAFERVVSPLFGLIANNHQESRTLAQTRDLLLPKLLSGNIEVKC